MMMAVPEEVRAKIVAQIPVGRLGEPDEIAYAVAFFRDDKAAWCTGANLAVNGGITWGCDSFAPLSLWERGRG